MKVSDFVKLAEESATKTSSVRIYSKWATSGTGTGVESVRYDVVSKFGALVTIIDKLELCTKDQYLLVYNLQCGCVTDSAYYCTVDMLIKPIKDIKETHSIEQGTHLSLVFNGNTGEVLNDAQGVSEISRAYGIDLEESEAEKNLHKSYGIYNNIDKIGAEAKKAEDYKIVKTQTSLDNATTGLAAALIQVQFFLQESTPDQQSDEQCDMMLPYYKRSSYVPKSPPPPPDPSLPMTRCFT